MDFDEGFILMGHDGPGHIAISTQSFATGNNDVILEILRPGA